MGSASVFMLIAIAVYLLAVIAIGVGYAKHNDHVSDFYLGDRQLGPVITAMSAEASDMSGWLLLGLPGVAYLSGMADAATRIPSAPTSRSARSSTGSGGRGSARRQATRLLNRRPSVPTAPSSNAASLFGSGHPSSGLPA